MADKYGTKWNEEETILAFYYYCQIPFGKIHARNPEIIRIANLLGRTPGAVTRKMGNLAHFDDRLSQRGISGLKNTSKLDKEIANRFFNNWEDLAFQAKMIEGKLDNESFTFPEGSEKIAEVKKRVNQSFFRNAVLNSYNQTCCMTGIKFPDLLIASHIKPWKDSDPKTERTNPANGLCLNALHDKAFDKGLITVLPHYTIRVSTRLKQGADFETLNWLIQCDGQKITLPHKYAPSKLFLEWHNDVVFLG